MVNFISIVFISFSFFVVAVATKALNYTTDFILNAHKLQNNNVFCLYSLPTHKYAVALTHTRSIINHFINDF